VKSPTFYKSRAELWQRWLDDNPDEKPATRAIVARIVAAYSATLPAAVLEFERLQSYAPPDEVATRGAYKRPGGARNHGRQLRRDRSATRKHRGARRGA
jgi:hypothetical protein